MADKKISELTLWVPLNSDVLPFVDWVTNETKKTTKEDLAWLSITWRWAYDNATQYFINDAVSFNGSSYICIVDSLWNLPTDLWFWDPIAVFWGSAWYTDSSEWVWTNYWALIWDINGVNTTFTVSQWEYNQWHLIVYLNWQLQTQWSSSDFVETNPWSWIFDFIEAPSDTKWDIVIVNYNRSSASIPSIDDDTPSITNTYSSERIEERLAETTSLQYIYISSEADFPNQTPTEIDLWGWAIYDLQWQTVTVTKNMLCWAQTWAWLRIQNGTLQFLGSFIWTDPASSLRVHDLVLLSLAPVTLFQFSDYNFFRTLRSNIIFLWGGTLWDMDTTWDGIFNGLMIIKETFFGWLAPWFMASLWTVNNGTVTYETCRCVWFWQWWTFTDNFTVSMDEVEMFDSLNSPWTRQVDIQWNVDKINIRTLISTPQSNEKIFNFDPTLIVKNGLVNLSSIDLSQPWVDKTNIFETWSQNQESPNFKFVWNNFISDSTTFGSMIFADNITDTVISIQWLDRSITTFADAWWWLVTVTTSVAHGFLNGDVIVLRNNTNYNGTFTISNVTASTFDITAVFNWDDATWVAESWWVKVLGTTFEWIFERASMPLNNRLLFSNREDQKWVIATSISIVRWAWSWSPTFEFSMFKNDWQILINGIHTVGSAETGSWTAANISIITPDEIQDTDYIELYARNITNTANVLVQNGTILFS